MDKERIEVVRRLKEFKNMAKDYEIERIVFFGSRATGDYGKHSDVDLILVSKKFRGKSFLKRPLGLHRYWKMKYPVDFICYTPEEFEKLSKGVTIVQQALKKGIEI